MRFAKKTIIVFLLGYFWRWSAPFRKAIVVGFSTRLIEEGDAWVKASQEKRFIRRTEAEVLTNQKGN